MHTEWTEITDDDPNTPEQALALEIDQEMRFVYPGKDGVNFWIYEERFRRDPSGTLCKAYELLLPRQPLEEMRSDLAAEHKKKLAELLKQHDKPTVLSPSVSLEQHAPQEQDSHRLVPASQ